MRSRSGLSCLSFGTLAVALLLIFPLWAMGASGVQRGNTYYTHSTLGNPRVTPGHDVNVYYWQQLPLNRMEPNTDKKMHWVAGAADVESKESYIKSKGLGAHSASAGVCTQDSILVTVAGTTYDYAVIKCTNTILASFRPTSGGGRRHTITGSFNATDINGKLHPLTVSLERGEPVGASTVSTKSVQIKKNKANGGVSAALSTEGAGAAAELKVEGEATDATASSKDQTVVPVPSKSPKTQVLGPQVAEATWPGPCTLVHEWNFQSSPDLTLTVEPYDSATLGETRAVIFKVDNDCSASWKKWTDVREPSDPEPPNPDVIYGTPDTMQSPVVIAMGPAITPSTPYAVSLPGGGVAAIRLTAAHGIEGEVGTRSGMLCVETDTPHSSPLTFALSTSPSSITDLPATLQIEANTMGAPLCSCLRQQPRISPSRPHC